MIAGQREPGARACPDDGCEQDVDIGDGRERAEVIESMAQGDQGRDAKVIRLDGNQENGEPDPRPEDTTTADVTDRRDLIELLLH